MTVASHIRSRNNDPLLASVVAAILIHAILILGLKFAPLDHAGLDRAVPTLDVMMVPRHDDDAPKQADYLAASNRDGAGNTAEHVVPQLPRIGQPNRQPPKRSQNTPTRLTTRQGRQQVSATPVEAPRTVTAAELIGRSLELVALGTDTHTPAQVQTDRPRQMFIDARTREHKYASYMASWVAKVERIGNLNYPERARRQGLSGTLLLDVALLPDGTVKDIVLLTSSGHKPLDDAAERIVRMSAPFAAFPPEIRKETDILHVTRTWEFLSDNRLYSR